MQIGPEAILIVDGELPAGEVGQPWGPYSVEVDERAILVKDDEFWFTHGRYARPFYQSPAPRVVLHVRQIIVHAKVG